MGRLAYGEISKERTAQLLEALLDFSNNRIDPSVAETLTKKGLVCDRVVSQDTNHPYKQTSPPKLDFRSTRPLLIELVQVRYQDAALIDSKPKLKEALDHLQQTLGYLRLRHKAPGQRIVDGTLTLYATETAPNLAALRARWPQKSTQNQGPTKDPTKSPSKSPQKQKQSQPPQTAPNAEQNAETLTTPNTAPKSEQYTEQNTEQDSQNNTAQNTWEDIFDQVAATLKDTIPHSPIFRALLKVLGINAQAHITPSDRRYLIQRVEKMWLNDYLKNALGISDQWPTLQISLADHHAALAQHRNLFWENPQQLNTATPLPPNTRLIEQFNGIKPLRRLLILGPPGSGKTIALLELLQSLCTAANTDDAQPIPVIVNLSSYGLPPEGRNFTRWLITQLEQQYSLTQARGRRFLDTQKLLLLLDGLDEVRNHIRSLCIRQINDFLRQYRNTECIICSRITEYETAQDALQLEASLQLLPLTPQQSTRYLQQLPNVTALHSLIQTIHTNPDFQQLAETPLMLNVMAVAYQGSATTDLPQFTTEDDHRRYLYNIVLERLLNRKQPLDKRQLPAHRQGEVPYTPEEMRTWLIWLAKRMVEHDQTTFFIEQLRPSWLDTPSQRKGYRLNSHAFVGIFLGIISACHLTPIVGWEKTGEVTQYFLPLLATGISGSVLASLLFNSLRRRVPQLMAGFIAASCYVIFFFFIGHPFVNSTNTQEHLALLSPIAIDWLGMSLFWGLMNNQMRNQMVIIHRLSWSWSSAFRFISVSMLAYWLIYFPIRLYFFGRYQDDHWIEIAYEPLVLIGLTAIYGGFAWGNVLTPENIFTPNQGMRKALRNVALLGSSMGTMGMLAAWQYAHGNPYEFAMIAGSISLLAAVIGGQRSGQVLIQHFILRIILWWNRSAPWNYARFLEFATRQMLMKRVGGGYLFMHRSFMEYLAEET